MMRRAVVVSFLLVFGLVVRGSSVYRYEVDRGSDLEKEFGYELSVHEEHDEKQPESLDKVSPMEGAAPPCTVKFHVPVANKLKDLFELDLSVNDGNAILAQVPLAIRSRFTKENEVDVQFLIRKDWIDQAVLDIRCAPWMSAHTEAVYSIRLGDYMPGYGPTETQRIAKLRKRHPSIGLLAWHRSKNPPDYSNNLSVLTVAQKLFPEVSFIGFSRAGLETLLGPPDTMPLSPKNSVIYTYRYGDHAVIRRFHFNSKGNVESVEKIPHQWVQPWLQPTDRGADVHSRLLSLGRIVVTYATFDFASILRGAARPPQANTLGVRKTHACRMPAIASRIPPVISP